MSKYALLRDIALEETTAVQRSLPDPLRAAAAGVPVILERRADIELAGESFEPDLLGLFVGPDFAGRDDHGALPPQILLFLESLWEFSGNDETIFREEVRATYLHELGHYLGLDEDELDERGLA